MSLIVRVMTEYKAEPLWVRHEGDDIHVNTNPHELGLSAALVGRLEAWRSWGESFVNFDDPHDSRAVTDGENAAFHVEGRLLTRRVAAELPKAVVYYAADGEPHCG